MKVHIKQRGGIFLPCTKWEKTNSSFLFHIASLELVQPAVLTLLIHIFQKA